MPRPTPHVGFSRVASNGYVIVWQPGHHRAYNEGYVYEHVLIAEKALGKPLSGSHPVHHFNEIKIDNRNGNLVICEDNAYHKLLHFRTRVLLLGGDQNVHKICGSCGLKPKTEFGADGKQSDGLMYICRKCRSVALKIRYAAKQERLKNEQRRIDL